jgi:hypothetical protein
MGFERADSTVEALAAGCVEAFDGFRQPASEEEMARRRATGLSPCQDALLLRWGYPYVMEEFRFHMTLTGPLAEGDLDRAEAVLEDLFAEQFGRRLQVCDICLFEQPGPDAPFRVLSRHPFSLGP